MPHETEDATMAQITNVHLDARLQPRDGINPDVVAEYAEAMKRGDRFPEVEVVTIAGGEGYFVIDGFHRVSAYEKIGQSLVGVSIAARNLTLEEAQWMASKTNRLHGLRRSNADKRKAAALAIRAKPNESDHLIAEQVGLSQTFVSKVRRGLTAEGEDVNPEKRKGKDGKERATPEQEPKPECNEEDVSEIESIIAGLDTAFAKLKKMKDEEHPNMAEVNVAMLEPIFDEITRVLRTQAIPSRNCPYCDGQKCGRCFNRGWVSKDLWELMKRE